MAQRQQDLFWFDFLLRVHNVLFIGGFVLGGVLTLYAVGGQWLSGAAADVPHWVVFSDQYSTEILTLALRAVWFHWYIVIPLVYGSAIWVTKKMWY
jgi:hypothetical protein